MEEKAQRKEAKEIFSGFSLIIILAAAIYSNSFYASWHLDDYPAILGNYKIKNLSKSLYDVFFNPRGICDLSFAVNYYFKGADVFGFHIINFIIHIISAFMVYFLIKYTLNLQESKSTNKFNQLRNLPLIGSLIFVAHPIQTQAVTYIAQRYTSLSTMFYLIALVLFIKARMNLINGNKRFLSKSHIPFYVCSFFCTLLAMKTKEIAVTIPFIFLLYDYMFLRKTAKSLMSSFLYIVPFFVLVLIPVIFRIYAVNPEFTGIGEAIGRSFKDTVKISRIEYFLTSINVVLTYIRLLFFPVNQNIYHLYPISSSIFSNYTYISLLVHTAILILAISLFKVSRIISFGVFWFYITISVESSIIPIRDVIFEHRVYLPSVGFLFFIIGVVLLMEKRKNILYALFLVLIAMFSILTYGRNYVWSDELTLWNDCLAKSKNNSKAYFNLGTFYLNRKKYDTSSVYFKKALEVDPTYADVHNNLGFVYEKSGLTDMAVEEYRKAVKLRFNYPDAHNNLGSIYYNHGRIEEGIKEIEIAIKLKPDFGDARNNLGSVFYNQERLDEAVNEYRIASKLKPDSAEIHLNLGRTYFRQKRLDDAIKEFKLALKINPNLVQARQAIEAISKR